jgi:hypothetical protein
MENKIHNYSLDLFFNFILFYFLINFLYQICTAKNLLFNGGHLISPNLVAPAKIFFPFIYYWLKFVNKFFFLNFSLFLTKYLAINFLILVLFHAYTFDRGTALRRAGATGTCRTRPTRSAIAPESQNGNLINF